MHTASSDQSLGVDVSQPNPCLLVETEAAKFTDLTPKTQKNREERVAVRFVTPARSVTKVTGW